MADSVVTQGIDFMGWANGMMASAGTVRVIDTTPAGDAFGCTTITRMPGQTRLDMRPGLSLHTVASGRR